MQHKKRSLFLLGTASALLLYLTSLNPSFGIFRDEFYYLSCARRLAGGYVDHPPFSILILSKWVSIFGDSIYSIRILPSIAYGLTVFYTGMFVLRLGGALRSAVYASFMSALMLIMPVSCSFYSMNAFEPLFWLSIIWNVCDIVQTGEKRSFNSLGILAGAAIMNKHTALFFLALMAVALLVNGNAREFMRRRMFFVIFLIILTNLPNILWQYNHGFPSFEFYREATLLKNNPTNPLQVIVFQVLLANVFALPVWGAGLVYLLRDKEMKEFRFVAYVFILLLAFMVISGSSRPDRMTPIYPVLLAFGMVKWENYLKQKTQLHRVLKGLTAAQVIVFVVMLPVFVPVFSAPVTAAYTSRLGINPEIERGKRQELFQLLADRTGWEKMAQNVEKAYLSFPAEERKFLVITCQNYGQASAIEYFSRAYSLPVPVSGHNNWFVWGVPSPEPKVFLNYGDSRDRLEQVFADVRSTGVIHNSRYGMQHENNIEIFVSRGSKYPLARAWQMGKHYE